MYDVLLRDTFTEEERIYHMPLDWEGEYGHTFLWEEGNYSCDCNRHKFFQWAGDEEEELDECGDGRYLIEISVEGEVVYTELQDNVDDK